MKLQTYSTFIILFIASLAMGQNITHPNVTAPGGMSVNTFNGNLFQQRTDVFIPGRGLSLEITFSYNSNQLGENRGKGNGWRLNYDMCYQLMPDQSVVIDRMDGRRDTFTLDNGIYLKPTGIFDSLSQPVANQFELRMKNGTKYFFENASHKALTKIEDRNGNSLILSYTSGKLNAVTDPTGRMLNFTWSGDNLTSITNVNTTPHRVYQYAYDGTGNLVKYTNPEMEEVQYYYGPGNQLLSKVDENANEIVVSYNSNGAVRQIASCESRMELTYNPAIHQTYLIEEKGNTAQTTTYTFDTEGNLKNQRGNCCGFNTSFEYDADKNLTKRIDGKGNETNFNYDNKGNRLAIIDVFGKSIDYTYESVFNQVETIKDKNGNTTSFVYNADGNLEEIHRPLGVSEFFSYDANGNVSSSTDGAGNTTNFTYNSNGYLTSINYPIGSETYTYDDIGNLMTIKDANNHEVTFTYDFLNRPLTVTDHLGNTRTFQYDSNGNLTLEKDENLHDTNFDYDILNRLTAVTTPVATYNYQYDQIGNLTQVLDGNGHATAYEYNEQNLLSSLTDAEGLATHYQYDANGNLTQRIDANGNTTTYSYDDLNRLTQKAYNGNTDNYEYDDNGNLTSASNDHITINYSYDALNRLESKTYVDWNKTISYTYDGAGNRKTMTDPDGGLTNYDYDNLNRLISLENPSNLITTFEYDDAGRLEQQNNGNGTRAEYTYDNADRVLSITHITSTNTVLQSFNYTYDSKGNRLSMTDENGGLNSYTYDDADRLTAVSYADGQTESFTYDAAGNRTQLNRNGIVTDYTYDKADRIKTAGSTSFVFDSNGNMLEQDEAAGTTTYSYDGEDRLIQVDLPSGMVVSMEYDPFGERLVKDVDGVETRFVIDGVNVLMELNGGNGTEVRYTSSFWYNAWYSINVNSENYFLNLDYSSNVKSVTTNNQNIELLADYFVYGDSRNISGNLVLPISFSGQYQDLETNLFHFRTRYYSSFLGRFVTKDKFEGLQELPISLNKYAYANNNPVNYIDPNGELPTFIAGAIGGALVSIGLQVAGGLLSGKGFVESLKCIDFADVGTSALVGALGLGIGGNIKNIANGFSKTRYYSNLNNPYLRGIPDYLRATGVQNAKNEIKRGVINIGVGVPISVGGKKSFDKRYGEDSECEPPEEPGDQEETPAASDEQTAECITGIQAVDPNEIKAPEGVGTNRWVSKDELLEYTIYFENDPDSATAAAQIVKIVQDLDSDLDPQTFKLSNFGFGPFNFEVPSNSTHYTDRLDVKDSVGVLVDVEAGIDFVNNRITWEFVSIDSISGVFTTDPFAGFLPVNDSTGIGEGFVTYTIQAKESAVTMDSIHAQADIIFDTNDALATNIEVNLVDADAPESEVLPVIAAIDSSHLIVNWMGTDVGSGVKDYTLYVSRNDGPFLEWLADTSLLTAIYQGTLDSTYCFISISRDSVSNLESYPDSCITMVAFSADLLDNCPTLADIVLNSNPLQSGTYRASNSITSDGTVAPGSDVNFKAAQEIELGADFYVMPGAEFYAAIEACSSNLTGGDDDLKLQYDGEKKEITFQLLEAQTVNLYLELEGEQLVKYLIQNKELEAGNHTIQLNHLNNKSGDIILKTKDLQEQVALE